MRIVLWHAIYTHTHIFQRDLFQRSKKITCNTNPCHFNRRGREGERGTPSQQLFCSSDAKKAPCLFALICPLKFQQLFCSCEVQKASNELFCSCEIQNDHSFAKRRRSTCLEHNFIYTRAYAHTSRISGLGLVDSAQNYVKTGFQIGVFLEE